MASIRKPLRLTGTDREWVIEALGQEISRREMILEDELGEAGQKDFPKEAARMKREIRELNSVLSKFV